MKRSDGGWAGIAAIVETDLVNPAEGKIAMLLSEGDRVPAAES